MKKFTSGIAILCALPFISLSALAADTVWNFNSSQAHLNIDNKRAGNTLSTFQNGQSLEVTAWSGKESKRVKSAIIGANEWGLLATNTGQGHSKGEYNDGHYIDNEQSSDMLLFSFENSVSVSGLRLGAVYNDRDLSIAAFSSMPILAGRSWENIANQAVFKESYSNADFSHSNTLSFSNIVTEAKYWLIGAYNTNFGGNTFWTGEKDYFKLVSLTTHFSPRVDVPAPATALLFGALGMLVLRRRK
ncbi:exosortase-dependent surface protein XDP1 [Salinimonas chungwhensis]|uniref:exosortase-dependent surface protein XDP1 n=1 Tax=Salinimonas chungwhensis TaxID=265425 RepID=UPI00035D70D7|nr:exosortase-dependent surface protein XDP1 [Salinimonas chungwhensis]